MSIYKDPKGRSPFYWTRLYVKGREYRRSTGTADSRKALAFERELRKQLSEAPDPEPAPVVSDTSFVMLAGLDQARAERETSEEHVAAVKLLWRPLCSHFGNLSDARLIRPEQLDEYVNQRRDKVSGQTIRKELQALRRAYAIAEKRRLLRCPLLPADWPKVKSTTTELGEKRTGKFHPPTILRQWLKALPPDAREFALFTALTGLRRTEVERLTADWVEPLPNHMVFPKGSAALLRIPASSTKSRKPRGVILPRAAVAIIKARLKRFKPGTPAGTPVFGRADHKRAYKTAVKTIGYNRRITLRDLRHTYASIGAAKGSVVGARDALGHAELSTTNRYVTAQLEDVAAVSAAVTGVLLPEYKRKKGL